MKTDEYLVDVINKLQNGPTTQDIDYLVEAFTRIGYLAADGEGLAEEATNIRRFQEATFYLKHKKGGEKVTEREAEALAAIDTKEYRDREAEANTKARKLKNLLDSIREAINAIKYIGRVAG